MIDNRAGATDHLAGELFKTMAGVNMVHVPYKGGAPAGTPREIVGRLNGEVAKILQMSDVRARLQESGIEAASSTPEQFAAYIQSEIKRWAKVVREAGMRAD